MEEQLPPVEVKNDPTTVFQAPIYSKRAIYGFAFFFSTIFGAALLRQNLVDTGNKKAANQVLLFSIVYTSAQILLLSSIERPPTMLVYLLNLAGAGFLIEVYFKKNFPASKQYKLKKIRFAHHELFNKTSDVKTGGFFEMTVIKSVCHFSGRFTV